MNITEQKLQQTLASILLFHKTLFAVTDDFLYLWQRTYHQLAGLQILFLDTSFLPLIDQAILDLDTQHDELCSQQTEFVSSN